MSGVEMKKYWGVAGVRGEWDFRGGGGKGGVTNWNVVKHQGVIMGGVLFRWAR